MKIIYIAPNPLKGSRRITKSVTATLHHKSSTIKYKQIHSSCILKNQKKEVQFYSVTAKCKRNRWQVATPALFVFSIPIYRYNIDSFRSL